MMRRLFFLLSACFIAMAVLGAFFIHDVFLLTSNKDATPMEVTIAAGSSVSMIAKQLEASKIITHPTFFKWFVAWTRAEQKLQAGTFSFLRNTSIVELVLDLTNAEMSEVQVTIPEGFTNRQIKSKLSETFLNLDTHAWDAQTKNLEGYLFPDTYRFAKNASVNEIVQKMRSTLDRRLLENGIVKQKEELEKIIILASILEKEVQTPEDMKHVAGILFNRMQIGMVLQVDSTITYVTEKSSEELTTADLKLASPYNTYTHKGLPPTPICNPGMHAILAVLNPTPSQDFYFLTTKDGHAVYAKTHDEHVRNKQKYLR